jgi:hypothetical protein
VGPAVPHDGAQSRKRERAWVFFLMLSLGPSDCWKSSPVSPPLTHAGENVVAALPPALGDSEARQIKLNHVGALKTTMMRGRTQRGLSPCVSSARSPLAQASLDQMSPCFERSRWGWRGTSAWCRPSSRPTRG